VRAISAGVAWLASVSISRDLEISQFWQNLHARLHPAVPNDSTADPGRKWLSERLLLDRIDAEPAGASVAGELHLVVNPAADEAQSALALVKFAGARTYVALDPPVVEVVPVFGRDSERVVL